MKLKYSQAIEKFKKRGHDVTPYLIDEALFEIDFISKETGCKKLKTLIKECSSSICYHCFNALNLSYFDGQLSYKTKSKSFWIFFKIGNKKQICLLCDNHSSKEKKEWDISKDEVEYEKELAFAQSIAACKFLEIFVIIFDF